MANPNGKKGAAFERSIADCLIEHVDDRIDRRVKTGAADKGDIGGWRIFNGRVVVECKNVARLNIAGWLKEAEIERVNDGALAALVIHKARGKGNPLDQHVTMTVRELIALTTGVRPE